MRTRRSGLFALLAGSVVVALICSRAWITQDAFISMRYVENLHAGHGLVFNVGERVQGFTHPLWVLLLALGPTNWLYYHAIALGLIFTVATLFVAWRRFCDEATPFLGFVIFCIAVVTSKSARDWSTGGLENSFSHFATIGAIGCCLARTRRPVLEWSCAFYFGALLFNRLDQVLLVAPVIVWRVASSGSMAERLQSGRRLLIGLIPLFAWLAFAAFYYGFPLPNTSYAKVSYDGLDQRFLQSYLYYLDYFRSEPIHFGLLVVVICLSLVGRVEADRRSALIAVAVGISLQLSYVGAVGGDYMRGRFLSTALYSEALLLGLLASTWRWSSIRAGRIATLVVVAVLAIDLVVTHFENVFDPSSGVARISRYYTPFPQLSATTMRTRDRIRSAQRELDIVEEYSNTYGPIAIQWTSLGDLTFGYGAGLHVIDRHGLIDAFVARCRPSPRNRPGHVQRAIPLAYLQARHAIELIPDWRARLDARDPGLARAVVNASQEVRWTSPHAKQVFDELETLTRGPLLSAGRWGLILKYTFTNPAAYDSNALAYAADDIPAELIRSDGPIKIIGFDPAAIDFADPVLVGGAWLGAFDDGELSIRTEIAEVGVYSVRLMVQGISPAARGGACLQVYRDNELVKSCLVKEPQQINVDFDAPKGPAIIRLRINTVPGNERFFLDPRPVMLYVSGIVIGPAVEAATRASD